MAPSVFARVELAPRDPILGITEAYNADPNPRKVNLGVGVYYDDNGKIPLLECVRQAERQIADKVSAWGYLPIDGLAAYDREVQRLVCGPDSAAVREKRVVTVQALGGTGGLKIGADFLKRISPAAQVWISDPSWENHRALFESAGFEVRTYAYYDPQSHGLDFTRMVASFETMPAGSIVVLHACCHNPTGVDLSSDEWTRIIDLVQSRNLVPFLDIAYQGFGDSLESDGAIVRRFAALGIPVFVSSSYSKSFSLYGERVGALSVVTTSPDEAERVLSQLKRVVRTNYSNPPTHGGQIVAIVLASDELRALWEQELAGMRDRIKQMRRGLVDGIHARAKGSDFGFVVKQRGMFSYSGLTKDQVHRLRSEFGVYAVDSGRICVAALNTKNLDYVVDAVSKVIA